MMVDKKVYVVIFTFKFNKLCFKILADVYKYLFQVVQDFFRKNFASKLCHEDQMDMH